jgi:hypothetical protein
MLIPRRIILFATIILGIAIVLPLRMAQTAGATNESTGSTTGVMPNTEVAATTSIYLPMVTSVWAANPFGVEMAGLAAASHPTIVSRADELGARWSRVSYVSWRDVQPVENGPYNWSALAAVEKAILAANQASLIPMVMIHETPHWAAIRPTSCAAVREGHFDDFARFMEQVVNRYKVAPYNVKYWELGNEPDVDPDWVPVDAAYGCWGDESDGNYGGRRYGEMLKVVTPAIKRADPEAKVMIGGILGAPMLTSSAPCPDGPVAPGTGRQDCFLEGILRAGAGNAFDIVAYHGHWGYYNGPVDYYPTSVANPWSKHGGPAKGKPKLIRETLSRYGLSKPLSLNETSLGCDDANPAYYWCKPATAAFFQAQANHVARMIVPSMSVGVESIIWYSVNDPGWRNTGLLDRSLTPRPSYNAYKTLVEQAANTVLPTPQIDIYGDRIEAYRFRKASNVVDVLWSYDAIVDTLTVPQGKYIKAFSRDGAPLTPAISNGNAIFSVDGTPIYIHRLP